MERGKLRMQKAISRSVLVQLQIVEIVEQVRKEQADIEDYVDFGDVEESGGSGLRGTHEPIRGATHQPIEPTGHPGQQAAAGTAPATERTG